MILGFLYFIRLTYVPRISHISYLILSLLLCFSPPNMTKLKGLTVRQNIHDHIHNDV